MSLPDHVHGLDSGDRPARGWIALESQHRLADPFDEPMILLDDVVEVLALSVKDGDWKLIVVDRLCDGHFRRRSLVRRDHARHPVVTGCQCLSQETLRGVLVAKLRYQEINGFTVGIDRSIQIVVDAVYLQVGFIHSPGIVRAGQVPADALLDDRGVFLDPAHDGGVAHTQSALAHDLFDIPVGERILQVPPHGKEDDFRAMMFPLEQIILHLAVSSKPKVI